MAIYDFFELEKNESQLQPLSTETLEEESSFVEAPISSDEPIPSGRDRFFSALTARLFFFVLFLADICWGLYALALWSVSSVLVLVTFLKVPFFRKIQSRSWLNLRRSSVCGISLMMALFSPSFGILVACTYFLMFDKSGIEEVVPSSLQSQFKDFLKTN